VDKNNQKKIAINYLFMKINQKIISQFFQLQNNVCLFVITRPAGTRTRFPPDTALLPGLGQIPPWVSISHASPIAATVIEGTGAFNIAYGRWLLLQNNLSFQSFQK
jgi:hypothetical protein